MAFSTLKLGVGTLPPAAQGHESLAKRPATAPLKRTLPLQVRSEEDFAVSRRDALLSLTAASLCGFTFLSTDPVQARNVKPETRKKIMEKLELLREKAGLPNRKPKDGEKAPSPQPFAMEKPLPHSPPLPTRTPNPQERPAGSLVEAIFT